MANNINLKGIKIFIDPGHGGSRPDQNISGSEIGTTGYSGYFTEEDGVYEKDINLNISLYLKGFLEEAGASVKMSRINDVAVSLEQRTNQANSFNPDLFISVHNNATTDPQVGGTMVLYPPRGRTDGTQELSEIMAKKISQKLGIEDLGAVLRDDLFVLNNTKVPAILVEGAFMTNPDEEEMLKSNQNQRLIAEGIVEAIEEFKGKNPEFTQKKRFNLTNFILLGVLAGTGVYIYRRL